MYTTTEDLRIFTHLSTTEVTDDELYRIIQRAQAKVNADISKLVVEEPCQYIDIFRQNRRDGSNTTYWMRNSFPPSQTRSVNVRPPQDSFAFFGDMNNDGALSIADVKVYEYNYGTQVRSQLTTATINEIGYVTVSAAPASGSTVTMTYSMVPVSINTPDVLVKTATEELAAAISYAKIEPAEMERIELRDLKIWRPKNQYGKHMERYSRIIGQINNRWLTKTLNFGRRPSNLGLQTVTEYNVNMGGVDYPEYPG